jgi:hypothetical protein
MGKMNVRLAEDLWCFGKSEDAFDSSSWGTAEYH